MDERNSLLLLDLNGSNVCPAISLMHPPHQESIVVGSGLLPYIDIVVA
jgi:hypothetical protein